MTASTPVRISTWDFHCLPARRLNPLHRHNTRNPLLNHHQFRLRPIPPMIHVRDSIRRRRRRRTPPPRISMSTRIRSIPQIQ